MGIRGDTVLLIQQEYKANTLSYIIRTAEEKDAAILSALRLKIDGETEHMDREQGEGFIDEQGFRELIDSDSRLPRNLFLVAETKGSIVGFARCEGIYLKRFAHKVHFGICVAKEYWGHGIGKHLMKTAISWADSNSIRKISLHVIETNVHAIKMYERLGFETEGIIKADKRLSDGKYYNTVIMGRCHGL